MNERAISIGYALSLGFGRTLSEIFTSWNGTQQTL
ncbi:IS4/Tn5 family transposase DNA-binding protein [Fischerella thermalis]|nr:hypothetical protein [Fischerella thermalis]